MADLDLDGILEDAIRREDDAVVELVRYVFRLRAEKRALLTERAELADAIRRTAAGWDKNIPSAPAFEVVDDFRRLVEEVRP